MHNGDGEEMPYSHAIGRAMAMRVLFNFDLSWRASRHAHTHARAAAQKVLSPHTAREHSERRKEMHMHTSAAPCTKAKAFRFISLVPFVPQMVIFNEIIFISTRLFRSLSFSCSFLCMPFSRSIHFEAAEQQKCCGRSPRTALVCRKA